MAWLHKEEGGLQLPGIPSDQNFSYDLDSQGVQSDASLYRLLG